MSEKGSESGRCGQQGQHMGWVGWGGAGGCVAVVGSLCCRAVGWGDGFGTPRRRSPAPLTSSHGKAHVCCSQGGGVVCAVAGHRHDIAGEAAHPCRAHRRRQADSSGGSCVCQISTRAAREIPTSSGKIRLYHPLPVTIVYLSAGVHRASTRSRGHSCRNSSAASSSGSGNGGT